MIRYKGVFDMDGLYKLLHKWVEKRGFEWHEPTFKDKHPQTGQEEEIVTLSYRNDTDFIRVWIIFYIHTNDMQDVEVVKDGKKVKMSKGRILISIGAQFEFDYEERWEGNKFQEALRHFMINYLFIRKIQTYGDKIEYEAHNAQEEIKKYFDMQTKGNKFADMW